MLKVKVQPLPRQNEIKMLQRNNIKLRSAVYTAV